MKGLTTRETFVRKFIADVAEEIFALRFGVEKFLVSFGGKDEVTVDLAAVEAEVEDASGRLVDSYASNRKQKYFNNSDCVNVTALTS